MVDNKTKIISYAQHFVNKNIDNDEVKKIFAYKVANIDKQIDCKDMLSNIISCDLLDKEYAKLATVMLEAKNKNLKDTHLSIYLLIEQIVYLRISMDTPKQSFTQEYSHQVYIMH